MALPSYLQLSQSPEFSSLPLDQKRKVTDNYWKQYATENPEQATAAQQLGGVAMSLVDSEADLTDAAPIMQRVQQERRKDTLLNLATYEGVRFGEIKPEEATAFLEQRKQNRAPIEQIYTEDGNQLLNNLTDLGRRTDMFGSPTLADRATDLTGQTNLEDRNRQYVETRNALTNSLGISPEEADDVVRHRLDQQEAPVSRDATGAVHIKTNLLFQPRAEIESAIRSSQLPESVKTEQLEGLDSRIQAFKANVVENTLKNHSAYAKEAGIKETNTLDRNFDVLRDSLITSRAENEATSLVSSMLPGIAAVGDVLNKLPGAREDRSNLFAAGPDAIREFTELQKSQLALSNEVNGERLKLWGTTGGTVGSGIGSIIESAVIARATGGLVPNIPGATRLAAAANRLAKVAPTAAIFGARQGFQTYDQAIEAGKTQEEAEKLGWTSALIEGGITAAASTIGAGGIEDIASGASRQAMRGAVKSAWKEGVKAGFKTVAGELGEEELITALDGVLTQAQINPNMTVEDLKQNLYDTAIATLVPSSAFGVVEGVNAATRVTPTYEQSTEELEQQANGIYAGEGVLPPVAESAAQDTASLTTERDGLAEQAAALPPGNPRRVELEDRIAEIDDTIGVQPQNAPEIQTQSEETAPLENVAGEPAIQETPSENVSQGQLDERSTDTGNVSPVGVEQTIAEDDYDRNVRLRREEHQRENLNHPDVGQDLNNLENSWRDKGVTVKVSVGNGGLKNAPSNSLHLDVVEVPESDRGKGIGSEVLTQLKQISDKTGRPIYLVPTDLSKDNSQPNLQEFYRKNGFSSFDRGESRTGRKLSDGYFYEPNPSTTTTVVDNPVQESPTPESAVPPISETPEAAAVRDEAPVVPSGETTTPPVVTPPETTTPVVEDNVVRATNASIDRDLRKIGQQPIARQARQSFGPIWDEAVAEAQQDPLKASRLITSLVGEKVDESGEFTRGNPRSVTAKEQATILYEYAQRKVRTEKTRTALNATTSPEIAEGLQERLQLDISDMRQAAAANRIAGAETARALRFRQVGIEEESFDLVSMQNRVQSEINSGSRLSPEQNAEIKALYERIRETEDQLQAVELEAYARGRAEAESEFLDRLKNEGRKRKTTQKEKQENLDRAIADAKKRIRDRHNGNDGLERRYAGLPFTEADVVDVALIATAYIRKGVISLDEFTRNLVAEFGDTIEPFAEKVFNEAKNLVANSGLVKTNEEILAAIDPEKELNRQAVWNMAKNHIQAGVPNNEVIDRIHTDLKKVWNGIERDDVSDAFTGYGREVAPKRSELTERLSELRKAENLTRQIGELEAGTYKGPKRTPKQKSDEIQRLTEQRDALLKAQKVTKPKDQLQTAKDSLKKQIDKFETAIRDNELIVGNQRNVQTDAELEALKQQRDQARKDYNEAFPEQGTQLTPNEEIDRVIKSLDKQIAREDKAIIEDLNKFSWFSPEISERRQALDAKRQARNELRWRESQEKSARESIERAEEIIRTGKLPERKSARDPKFTPTQQLQVLWDTRNNLNSVVAQMRRNEGADERAIKAVEKSIAELERRIAEKDFSTKPRRVNTNQQVADLRNVRKELQKTFNRLKNPPKSPEDRLVDSINKRTEAIRERIRKGDFSKETRIPREETKRIRDARLANSKAKAEWDKLFFEQRLKEQTKAQKALRILSEPINLSRTIITSLDLPPIFRQGMMATVTRPSIAFKNFPKALGAGLSEAKALEVEQSIRDNPQYELARAAKLALTESGPYASLSQQEEEFRGRWAKKIPGLKTVANFSERNYVTYLNGVRMDLFSTLTKSLSATGNVTVPEAKLIANYVNNVTGRGSWKQVEGSMSVLSAVFFSPRYWISRINTILGVFPAAFDVATGFQFRSADVVRARKAIAKEYARALIGYSVLYGSLIYGAAGLLDEEDDFNIEWNPTSSDFGKIRIGKSRFDPLAGMASNIVFVSRFLSQSSKSIRTGEVQEKQGDAFIGLITSYVRGKLAPLPGAVINYQSGKDVVGSRTTLRSELVGLFLPMSPADITEQLKEYGPLGAAGTALLTLMGVGTQIHDDGLTPKQQIAIKLGDSPSDFEKKKRQKKTRFSFR